MGADFLCSVCPLPSDITPEIKNLIKVRIDDLDESMINLLAEDYHYDWETEVRERVDNLNENHLFDLNNIAHLFKREVVQEMLEEALDEVIYNKERRDVAELILDHKMWLVSGGMSWGDSPTEAMNYIDLLERSSVLSGLNDFK